MKNWQVSVGALFISLVVMTSRAASLIAPYQLGTCVACHGVTGESVNPLWPNLGGQHRSYLLKQLEDMKSGKTRPAPIMMAVLTQLTHEDMMALSAYYEAQPIAIGKTSQLYLQPGEALYRGGNFQKQISACIACHGPGGEGNALAEFPAVSGQRSQYIVQQLQVFKNDSRKNDLNGIMRDISRRMSDEEMLAVANYMQGVYTPLEQTLQESVK